MAVGSCITSAANKYRVDSELLGATVSVAYSRGDERTQITNIARQSAMKHRLPIEMVLSVIHQESAFDPDAVSHAGAQGLMQIMPATASYLGLANPFDPAANVDAGARYLAEMKSQFGTWQLALAAYNAGPTNVRKYGGIPPFQETQKYVRKVIELNKHYRKVLARSTTDSRAIDCSDVHLIAQAIAGREGDHWSAIGELFASKPETQTFYRRQVYQAWRSRLTSYRSDMN